MGWRDRSIKVDPGQQQSAPASGGWRSRSVKPEQENTLSAAVGRGWEKLKENVGDLAVLGEGAAVGSGIIDKIGSANYAAQQEIGDLFRDKENQKTFDERYAAEQKRKFDERAVARERSPLLGTVADVVVGGTTGAALPIPGAGAKGLVGIGKRLAGTVGTSYLDAGTRGEGLFDTEAANQAAINAGEVQGALEVAVPVVGKFAGAAQKGVKNLADLTQKKADQRTIVAAVGSNNKSGLKRALENNDPAELAEFLRQKRIVRPFGTVEGAGERAMDLSESVGEGLGEFRKGLDKIEDLRFVGPKKPGSKAGGHVSTEAIAQKMREVADKKGPGARKMANNFADEATDFERLGNISFEDAQRFKQEYGFNPRDPNKRTGISSRDLDNEAYKAIEDQAEADIARLVQERPEAIDKEALENYLRMKRDYAKIRPVATAAEDRIVGNMSNNYYSPSDKAAGAAALLSQGKQVAENPLRAALGAIGAETNKFVRKRFDSTAGIAGDQIAKLLKEAPEVLGDYAGPLANYAKRGNAALSAAHFVLMQRDPEYRAKIEELEKAP